MKNFKDILIILLLIANLGVTGYNLAKLEGVRIEVRYLVETIETGAEDLSLLKSALFYDSKKAKKILYNRWFKGIKNFK